MMPVQFTAEVKSHLDRLTAGNNFYIYLCLRKFAEEKLAQIEEICKDLYFEDDTASKMQLVYLKELKKPDYIRAYVKRDLKATSKDSLYLCVKSLENFVYQQNETLKDAESFVYGELKSFSSHTYDLLDKIERVKKTVNQYGKSNKQTMIREFNTELNALYQKIELQPLSQTKNEIQNELTQALNRLQTKQDSYYDGLRFFSQRRKNNSTLQPNIDAARAMVTM